MVAAVGVVGVRTSIPSRDEFHPGFPRWFAVTALGILAFVAAHLLEKPIAAPVTIAAAATTGLAAVSEEAFFRRLVYGWLAGFGPLLAISAAAAAFAVVHVPAYGWSVLHAPGCESHSDHHVKPEFLRK